MLVGTIGPCYSKRYAERCGLVPWRPEYRVAAGDSTPKINDNGAEERRGDSVVITLGNCNMEGITAWEIS
jgi:hypothetical protein